jgi:hypothetical protein
MYLLFISARSKRLNIPPHILSPVISFPLLFLFYLLAHPASSPNVKYLKGTARSCSAFSVSQNYAFFSLDVCKSRRLGRQI